jgi:hypothetical protein
MDIGNKNVNFTSWHGLIGRAVEKYLSKSSASKGPSKEADDELQINQNQG